MSDIKRIREILWSVNSDAKLRESLEALGRKLDKIGTRSRYIWIDETGQMHRLRRKK